MEDPVGDADLAQIVQETGQADDPTFALREPQFSGRSPSQFAHAPTMGSGQTVAQLDGADQGTGHDLEQVERIEGRDRG